MYSDWQQIQTFLVAGRKSNECFYNSHKPNIPKITKIITPQVTDLFCYPRYTVLKTFLIANILNFECQFLTLSVKEFRESLQNEFITITHYFIKVMQCYFQCCS